MDWARQIHIKSPAEIAIMRDAGRINAEVLATVKALLQAGVSTADLNAAAEEVLKKHNCVSPFKGYGIPPYPTSITTCINREMVHGIPKKVGELVYFPMFHPAAALHQPKYRSLIEQDMLKIPALLADLQDVEAAAEQPPPQQLSLF